MCGRRTGNGPREQPKICARGLINYESVILLTNVACWFYLFAHVTLS